MGRLRFNKTSGLRAVWVGGGHVLILLLRVLLLLLVVESVVGLWLPHLETKWMLLFGAVGCC